MSEPKGALACLVCAWRENCQKKYSMPASTSFRCPDFERDRTLKEDEADQTSGDKACKCGKAQPE
jgi:hypothetical protein